MLGFPLMAANGRSVRDEPENIPPPQADGLAKDSAQRCTTQKNTHKIINNNNNNSTGTEVVNSRWVWAEGEAWFLFHSGNETRLCLVLQP